MNRYRRCSSCRRINPRNSYTRVYGLLLVLYELYMQDDRQNGKNRIIYEKFFKHTSEVHNVWYTYMEEISMREYEWKGETIRYIQDLIYMTGRKRALWPSFYTHYATICIYTYIYNVYVYMYVYIHTYICREILGEAESNRLHLPYIMIWKYIYTIVQRS